VFRVNVLTSLDFQKAFLLKPLNLKINKNQGLFKLSQKRVNNMDKFISEHLYRKEIEVYCGGNDIYSGTVIACADGVLTLQTETKLTFINIRKIISIWEL